MGLGQSRFQTLLNTSWIWVRQCRRIRMQLIQSPSRIRWLSQHGKLKRSGARGFAMSVDDLIIYKVLFWSCCTWRAPMACQKSSRCCNWVENKLIRDSAFAAEQKELLKSVNQREIDLLRKENKLITSVEELNSLVNKWTCPQETLHAGLNLEIRFRKLTVIAMKGYCALFKQKKLTVRWKI